MNKFNKENVQTFNVEVIKNVLNSGIDAVNMDYAISNMFAKSNEDTKMEIAKIVHDYALDHNYNSPEHVESLYSEISQQSWSDYFWSYFGH